MIRVEIVANRSVEENLLDAFREEGVGKFYTKYPIVLGVGSSGPRMGDAIWPEENFALVIWCEEAEAQGLEKAVAAVKKVFPDEGIKLFKPPAQAAASAPTIIYNVAPENTASPVYAPPAPLHLEKEEEKKKAEEPVLLSSPSHSRQTYGPESENY